MNVLPTILRSSIVGTGIGLLPGLGPTVASFASYALAKRMALPNERFGEGELKGVAAAETADNAVVPASFIPLFALGLPGSVSAAILIAALTIHGVTPGPRLFEEHARLIYGIYGTMLVASVLMLVVGRVGLVAFAAHPRAGDGYYSDGCPFLRPWLLRREQLNVFCLYNGRLRGPRLFNAPLRLFPRYIPDWFCNRATIRTLAAAVTRFGER